jgi:hypothetical protein
VRVGGEGSGHEAGAEVVHLDAGCAEAGDLDDGGLTEMEAGAGGEVVEVEAGGGDVLAHVAGGDAEGEELGLGEELGVDEVDLGEIGAGGVFADVVEVLDGGAEVDVTLYAEAFEELDGGLGALGEAMGWVAAYGLDVWGHVGFDLVDV